MNKKSYILALSFSILIPYILNAQGTESKVQIMYRTQTDIILSDGMARTEASMLDFLSSRTEASDRLRHSGVDSLREVSAYFDSRLIDSKKEYEIFNSYFTYQLQSRPTGTQEYKESIPGMTAAPSGRLKLVSTADEPVSGGSMMTFKNGIRVVIKEVQTPKGRVYFSFFLRGAAPGESDFGGVAWEDFRKFVLSQGIVLKRDFLPTGVQYSGSCPEALLRDAITAVRTAARDYSLAGGLVFLSGNISAAGSERMLTKELGGFDTTVSYYIDGKSPELRTGALTTISDASAGASVTMRMNSTENINSQRYLTDRLALVALKSELNTLMNDSDVYVTGECVFYPVEGFVVTVTCEPQTGKDGIDVLYELRQALKDIKATGIIDLKDSKNQLTGQIAGELNSPETLAGHLMTRYVDRKDLVTDYQKTIKSIHSSEVKAVMDAWIDGEIEEIIEK